jgi:hypothetical protein
VTPTLLLLLGRFDLVDNVFFKLDSSRGGSEGDRDEIEIYFLLSIRLAGV